MSNNCYFCKISIEKFGSFEKCFENMSKYQEIDENYSLSREKSAAQMGHLECLEKVHKEENVSMKGICNIAAANNNLQCLKYAHVNGDTIDEKTMVYACESNALGIMRYLHDKKCPWSRQVCETAAEYDHLFCLIYAHDNGCPWDEMTLYKAIQNNNFGCLEYAYENGCPSDEDMINEACKSNNIRILKYAHEIMKLPFDNISATLCCLKDGKKECLEYAHANDSPITQNTFAFAVENNLFECIKFLVENICVYNLYSGVNAAKYCDLDGVKYLLKNNILSLDEDTCRFAVQNKKISVIKYLIEQGCPWASMNIMKEIIKYDKLVFRKYFIKKYSLSISKDDFEFMLKNDSIKCLSYVYKFKEMFDNYYDNNMYGISHGRCRSFLKNKILKKEI